MVSVPTQDEYYTVLLLQVAQQAAKITIESPVPDPWYHTLWMELKPVLGVIVTVLLYVISQRLSHRSKAEAKSEAAQAAAKLAEEERNNTIKKLQASEAENVAQHTNFQRLIEGLGNDLLKIQQDVKELNKEVQKNASGLDAVKDGLPRVEGQLNGLMNHLLTHK